MPAYVYSESVIKFIIIINIRSTSVRLDVVRVALTTRTPSKTNALADLRSQISIVRYP